MPARAFITGLSGLAVTPEERAFLREARPWGFILFKRNIENKAQVIRLVGEVLDELGAEAAVLIDQEGGRVQRLQPPLWPAYPPGAAYGAIYAKDKAKGLAAARLGARLIAADLAELGINTDCLPLADVPVSGADQVIGNRAYGDTPEQVAAVAQAVTDGLAEGGVLPGDGDRSRRLIGRDLEAEAGQCRCHQPGVVAEQRARQPHGLRAEGGEEQRAVGETLGTGRRDLPAHGCRERYDGQEVGQ